MPLENLLFPTEMQFKKKIICSLILEKTYEFTWVTIGIPSKNIVAQMTKAKYFLRGRRTEDHLSTKPVMNDSTLQKPLSMPIICNRN